MKRQTFLAESQDAHALTSILAQAVSFAQNAGHTLTIFVPSIARARAMLPHVMGPGPTEKLVTYRWYRSNNLSLRLETPITFRPCDERGAVVALWSNNRMVDRLLDCRVAQRVTALFVDRPALDRWLLLNDSIIDTTPIAIDCSQQVRRHNMFRREHKQVA